MHSLLTEIDLSWIKGRGDHRPMIYDPWSIVSWLGIWKRSGWSKWTNEWVINRWHAAKHIIIGQFRQRSREDYRVQHGCGLCIDRLYINFSHHQLARVFLYLKLITIFVKISAHVYSLSNIQFSYFFNHTSQSILPCSPLTS